MSKQFPRSPTDDPARNGYGKSRHYEPLVLRDSRCRFIIEFLRRTHERSPVHVTELVDEFLTGEMDPVPDSELPTVRNDVYQMFSQHCLVQLETCGLVVYDRYRDTVHLR